MTIALRRIDPAPVLTGGGDLFAMLWSSSLPATLQDAQGRLVDVNAAFVDFTGHARESLIGRDPIELQPEEDRALHRALRAEVLPRLHDGLVLPPQERRLIDAGGRERWSRMVGYALRSATGELLLLSVLQDSTAEHAARAQAERSIGELASWFELSPAGMLLYDQAGLIVRSNPAFESLIGQVPVMLPEADATLQRLLGWDGAAMHADLHPGATVLQRAVQWARADGRVLLLVARLRAFDTEAGARRVMAMVEDRSAEDERDLAQLEIGALMNAAGIGVATFDASRGWRRSPARRASAAADAANDAPAGAALEGIHRDLVDPATRGEYERLQRALRGGERAQVRYAVHHPEMGLRWLLTRVEPAALPGPFGGGRTSSVVTLDITEQEVAQRRNEDLLRALTTILDGSPAGIAYLRAGQRGRCNRRFERMLGFAAGAVAGAGFEDLFRNRPAALRAIVADHPEQTVAELLDSGRGIDVEFDHVAADGSLVWTSLALRRESGAAAEMVAVLTDITRLKAAQLQLEALLRERELTFSLSDVGIAWLRGRHIERANAAFAALTGFAPAELAGMDIAVSHGSVVDGAVWEDQALAALRTLERFSAERLLRRRDGSMRWVQVAMRAVDAADPGAGVVCSVVDIDERQRGRQTLQLQSDRTRAVLDSVLVGIVTVGTQGIEWMNRSARRMFAGELGDFAGEPIGTVATDEPGHPLRRSDWLERLAEGQSETFECRLRGRDGREFWVVGNAVVTARDPQREGATGAGRQVTFALLDIELRRRAEIDIARAQASLQKVIDTAPLAIALFDAGSRRVSQLNQMAAAFFGQTSEQVLVATPASWEGWFGADQAAAFGASLGLALDSPEGVRREITRSSGAQLRLWDTRFVALDSGGGAAEVLMVASDVTEQRQAEQARYDAAVAQREMLVKEVHHRIKNNLQGVAGLLQQTAARRPEVQPVLTEAIGQVQAISQVYGLQVGSGGPVWLAGLLVAVAGSVQRTYGRVIEVDAGDTGWQLPEAESIPIALTVNELLSNAVKHGDGSHIGCALVNTDDGVAIEVRQRGTLAIGFDLNRIRTGVFGLGLVRALLPRRAATLSLRQDGEQVLARVLLKPPAVQRPGP